MGNRRRNPRHLELVNPCFLVFVLVVTAVATAEEPQQSAPKQKQSQSKIRIDKDIRYSPAEGKAGLCDVYLPTSLPPKDGYPVVLVIHGGGWITGDKWTLFAYSSLLAQQGFAAITINYRLAPQHKFPKQVDDVRQAMLWAQKNAKRLSLNLNRLGLFGYSAGGHLATLISGLADGPLQDQLDTSEWDQADDRWKQLPKIRAVCAGGPPCDFRTFPVDSSGMTFFLTRTRRQDPRQYEMASPTAHASAGDPVTMIIHGNQDLLVPIVSSRSLFNALKKAKVDVRFMEMKDHGHMSTFLIPETREAMAKFFREVL